MSILEAAARARHDLGKYVSFQARWLGPDSPPEALREALRADLLETRRGPDGAQDAASLWQALRAPLEPAGVARVDELVAALAERAVHLDELDASALVETAALARAVADELKAIHLRLRE